MKLRTVEFGDVAALLRWGTMGRHMLKQEYYLYVPDDELEKLQS